MPKLLVFLACEKVIIDQQNVVSAISLLQELKVQVPDTGHVPPPKASAAVKWEVLTLWLRTDDDAGKTYEQRLALFDPAGEPTEISGIAPIDTRSTNHRNIAQIYGFPIGLTGRFTLKLWLYESGKQPGEPIAEYPIVVTAEVLKK